MQFCAVERPFTSRCEKVMRDYSQASPADQNRRKEKHRVMSALQSLWNRQLCSNVVSIQSGVRHPERSLSRVKEAFITLQYPCAWALKIFKQWKRFNARGTLCILHKDYTCLPYAVSVGKIEAVGRNSHSASGGSTLGFLWWIDGWITLNRNSCGGVIPPCICQELCRRSSSVSPRLRSINALIVPKTWPD